MKKINIPAAFDRVPETWSPHIARKVNGQEIRIARIEGAFDWHRHDGVEEAFFVVKGSFAMGFRDGDREWEEIMEEGDLIVVPAGVVHRPRADAECWIMMVETAGTLNTGETQTERSKHDLPLL
ncbi:MAG: cupin domain-containing protein [Pseudomonadota bacterium]